MRKYFGIFDSPIEIETAPKIDQDGFYIPHSKHMVKSPPWPDHSNTPWENRDPFLIALMYVQNRVHLRKVQERVDQCPHCWKEIPYEEYSKDLITWSNHLSHMIKEHNYQPPLEFITFIASETPHAPKDKKDCVIQ